jgi:site-specific DNA-methyltransferase (adenine-specific)
MIDKSDRNKTIELSEAEKMLYSSRLNRLEQPASWANVQNKTLNQDLFSVLEFLPNNFVDLLFIDPPYNLSKTFNEVSFKKTSFEEYVLWVDQWLSKLVRTLKPNASVYICSDWLSSPAIFEVARRYFIVRNRITWEREKGRGALTNWKNSSEDILFCTISDEYTFHVEQVKLKKKVIAPYRTQAGIPKDWAETEDGNYRLTHPSNLWTDITVPFWSMPENTEHPTQKPEKLLAKIILASSNVGDMVFDPFFGSGTTLVTAKKLERNFCGVEIDPYYACICQKRLEMAESDSGIQGYSQGVFWERNTLAEQKSESPKPKKRTETRETQEQFL